MRQVILNTNSPYVVSARQASMEDGLLMPIDAEVAIKIDQDVYLERGGDNFIQIPVPIDHNIIKPSGDLALNVSLLPSYVRLGAKLVWFFPFTQTSNGSNGLAYMAGVSLSNLTSPVKVEAGDYLFSGRYVTIKDVKVFRD